MRRRASSPHLTQSLDPTRHSVIGPNPTHDIAKKHSTQPNPWMDPIQPNLWMDPNKPNPTQPDPFGRTQPNPIQPDPWMDTTQHDPWMNPTHVNLSVFTCLSACISRKRHVLMFIQLSCTLSVAVSLVHFLAALRHLQYFRFVNDVMFARDSA